MGDYLVKGLKLICTDVLEIEFSIPQGHSQNFKFSPGEYISLNLELDGKIYKRCYSISKLSGSDSIFICVKHVPKGIVSTYLLSRLKIGDTIELGSPEGEFVLKSNIFNRKRNIVFITGGSGVTPMIPMIQTLINKKHQGEITLINGNRNAESVIYSEVLEEFKDHIHVINVLEKPSEIKGNGYIGLLTTDQLTLILNEININKAHFYLSGPPIVVENAENALKALGVKRCNYFSEKFFTDSQKYADGNDHGIKVRTEKTFKSLPVASFRSVLDACIENCRDVDYSCRIGECKKCSCKLLKGKVNFNGKIIDTRTTILACQSFPLDNDTIIDFKKSLFNRLVSNRNYLMLIIFALVVTLLFSIRNLNGGADSGSLLSKGEPNTGHESISCNACHKNEEGSTRAQLQGVWNHYVHGKNNGVHFGKKPVTSAECISCHQRENDRHAIHRFNEPKYKKARNKIHPENCISCHSEHHGKRVTLKNTGFCINCHKDVSVKNDPIGPTHEDLVDLGQWETCMQCHDYHGNHIRTTPEDLNEAIPRNRIVEYFNGGKDPYGSNKKYKAINK